MSNIKSLPNGNDHRKKQLGRSAPTLWPINEGRNIHRHRHPSTEKGETMTTTTEELRKIKSPQSIFYEICCYSLVSIFLSASLHLTSIWGAVYSGAVSHQNTYRPPPQSPKYKLEPQLNNHPYPYRRRRDDNDDNTQKDRVQRRDDVPSIGNGNRLWNPDRRVINADVAACPGPMKFGGAGIRRRWENDKNIMTNCGHQMYRLVLRVALLWLVGGDLVCGIWGVLSLIVVWLGMPVWWPWVRWLPWSRVEELIIRWCMTIRNSSENC